VVPISCDSLPKTTASQSPSGTTHTTHTTHVPPLDTHTHTHTRAKIPVRGDHDRHKHGFNHQRAFRNEKGFNIQIGTKCHLFPSLLAFLNSPQARSKKDGLYLKCPCFTDSKFAQIHKKGAEEREVSYVGLDYIREGLRNAKVSSSSNIYGSSSTNNNNGNSDNHHHHHDGGGHAPTISSHSASNSNLVSHSPIYGSEPQVVVEDEKIRKKKKRLSWRKSKNYE
jgi:hypothetical protein